jgi:ROS/MUCR transcriptional regulator protein
MLDSENEVAHKVTLPPPGSAPDRSLPKGGEVFIMRSAGGAPGQAFSTNMLYRKAGKDSNEPAATTKDLGDQTLEVCRQAPAQKGMRGRDRVVCLECGGLATSLYYHLRSKHGMTSTEYRRKWLGAPTLCAKQKTWNREHMRTQRAADPEKHRKLARERYRANVAKAKSRSGAAHPGRVKKKYARERHARMRMLPQTAKRPTDWHKRPVSWRIIATELLLQDHLSNRELGSIVPISCSAHTHQNGRRPLSLEGSESSFGKYEPGCKSLRFAKDD